MIQVLESHELGMVAEQAGGDGTLGGSSELCGVLIRDGMRCGTLQHRFSDLVADDAIRSDVSGCAVDACEVVGEGWTFAFWPASP